MTFDLNALMKQAQEMQEQMQQLQEEAGKETAEASAGGGMVTVVASAAGELKELRIDPKAIDPDDPEMLADLVMAAANEALRAAAVLGKTFTFAEFVATLGGQPEDALLDSLDEAVSAQLLTAGGGDSFTFTHDKIREVLYEVTGRKLAVAFELGESGNAHEEDVVELMKSTFDARELDE